MSQPDEPVPSSEENDATEGKPDAEVRQAIEPFLS